MGSGGCLRCGVATNGKLHSLILSEEDTTRLNFVSDLLQDSITLILDFNNIGELELLKSILNLGDHVRFGILRLRLSLAKGDGAGSL